MGKKLFMFAVCIFAFIGMAWAQTTSVQGTVVSAEDNEPIIGAAVKVKGSQIGTVTDIDGKFYLKDVPASAKTLVVSYLGMETQQVPVEPQVEVKMKNSFVLDEVVVTAMGIKRDRKALGYASQDLKADQLITDGTTSMASAIQGKLTGVDIRQSSGAPGASAQIVIRGARSFDGNNQPLYVIDGMPVTTTPDFGTGDSVTGANIADRSIDINPDDIESINVLKGQAASALYGIRASNGVIVITTKRGSKSSAKPQITLSTNISAERVSRKFEHQTVYAQGNDVSSFSPSSSMSWGPKIVDLPNDPAYGGNVENSYTADGGMHQGMYYNPKRAMAGLDGWTRPEVYDNVGQFLGTGFTENTSLSITHNINGMNYALSLSNSYQKGIIPSTGMNRWNARGLVDWKINDQWTTGFSGIYSSSRITSAPGANSGIMNVVYSAPAEYDLKGIPSSVPGNPSQQVLFRATSFDNPYWWKDNCQYLQHTNRFFGNAYVEYSPKIGEAFSLKFREQPGIDIWTSNYADVNDIGSAANSKGEITNYGTQHNVFNNLFTATFDASFGYDSEWAINVVLGNEVNHENMRVWSYYGSNFNFYGMPIIGNATSFTSSEYDAQERTVGFFGSAMASWDNQVYLTVTARNDYVSSMPRGNRSFFYPSVSLGWEFTRLPVFKGGSVLNYGKLRASFAQVGQAGTWRNNFYYTPSYGSGFYQYTPVVYPLPSGVSTYVPYYVIYDQNLKPQNTVNYEVGADLYFFNNRLKVEYTYSRQNVKDQIFTVPTDGSIGYQYLMTNAGKMVTNSHEASVNAIFIDNEDWNVSLGVNFTAIDNKVVELAPGVESIMLGGFVEPQIRAQAGCTYPNIYGLAFKRDDKGNMLLFNGLPQATGDSYNLGNCSPDFVMGFNLNARYKKVSLAATLSWQQGGKMYHGTNMTMNYFGATKESIPYHEGTMVAEGIDEVTGQPNTVEVSKQDYYMAYYDVTESGIYDTSFLKLRDVTLSYSLPKIWKLDMSVYAFARNVLLWSKLPNFDPESSQGNGNMGGYFERFSIPATSSFGGGLTIKF